MRLSMRPDEKLDPGLSSPERSDSGPEASAERKAERRMSTVPLENLQKSRWERSWPTIACGAGLFSDGYLNGYVKSPHCAGPAARGYGAERQTIA